MGRRRSVGTLLAAHALFLAVALWRGWGFADAYLAYWLQAVAVVALVAVRAWLVPLEAYRLEAPEDERPPGVLRRWTLLSTLAIAVPWLAFCLAFILSQASRGNAPHAAGVLLSCLPFLADQAMLCRSQHREDLARLADGRGPDWGSPLGEPLLALAYPLILLGSLRLGFQGPAALTVLMVLKAGLDVLFRPREAGSQG